ncbi:MAG: hypothetical protein OEY97_03100 [Nitrospirota bacterium]|nr:hypothetical protein [Nitrospirota bacterium]
MKSKTFALGALALFGLGMIQMLAPTPAEAIPAFARANKVPCTTCHVQFPKLNEFGMAFKQNGYRMQGQKGKPVWLNDNLPLAAMTKLTFESRETDIPAEGVTAITDADRRSLEFFSGGHLGPNISYFFDYAFSIDEVEVFNGGTPLGTTTVAQAGAGGTFLVFSDILPDNLLNARVGVMSNEFFYLSQPRRTTQHGYLAPVSQDNSGLELNGHLKLGEGSGLRYATGYGNNFEENAEAVLGGAYAWAAYDIAGQTIGARYTTARAGDGATGATDTYSMLDLNANLRLGPTWMVLGWFSQDNVSGATGNTQENLLAEIVYPVTPRVLVTGRYESKESETAGMAVPGTDTETVLTASFYVMPNVNLTAEYVMADYGEGHPDSIGGAAGDDTILTVGFQIGL